MSSMQLLLAVPALAAVLGLVLLAGRAAQRFGIAPRAGQGGRLAAVQVLALDSRRRVHLLKCDDRHLLVLTGGGSDQMLGWVEPACPRETDR